jgi:hypothetical protein
MRLLFGDYAGNFRDRTLIASKVNAANADAHPREAKMREHEPSSSDDCTLNEKGNAAQRSPLHCRSR